MRHLFIFLFLLLVLPKLKAQSIADSVFTIQDVVVESVKAKNKDPFTTTNLKKEDIRKRDSGKDLPLLLDHQPSLITTSDAGTGVGYTGMRIRGTDQTRINITINGVPVNDAESQQVYFVDMPDLASSAGSIQIQRGVGTSTNGGGAFGASVNIQNNGYSKDPFGYLHTLFGSFGTRKHTLQGGSGLIKKRFFVEGQLSNIEANCYIDRAFAKLWSYHLKTGLVFKKSKLQFIHFGGYEKTYQAWYGVPKDSLATNRRYNVAGTDYGARNPAYHNQIDDYNQHYFQLFYNHQFTEKWSAELVGFTTLGKGFYEEYKANQKLAKYQLQSPLATRSDIVRKRWLDNVFYGGLWGVAYTDKKINASMGGMVAQYDGKHYGRVAACTACDFVDKNKNYYFSRGKKTETSVYAKINYTILQKLSLYLDLQYRYVGYRTAGDNNDLTRFSIDKKWHFFNPKAGISYQINPTHKLYASFAIANREPSRDELIDNKDTGIKPEQLYNAELGYQFAGKRWQAAANGYLMYYKNQLILTGKLNDVGNPIKVNTPVSYRSGIELSLAVVALYTKNKARELLALSAATTFSVNKIIDFEDRVPTYDADYNLLADDYLVTVYQTTNLSFSPSWVSHFALRSSPVKNLDISFSVKQVSRQYMDNTSSKERSISPYAYGDMSFQYTIPFMKNRSIGLQFNIHNLWNARYETNGYTFRERYADGAGGFTPAYDYSYYYPQAGIHFTGGFNVSF